MTTPTVSIPRADFEANKQALKTFVSQQGIFSDIDFEGSYVSGLVDILAYNTSISTFYKMMAVNETRQKTARLRNNVIARAQENGYVAKSFSSAKAVVSFTINSTNANRTAVVIPTGTVVNGRVDGRTFSFSTTEPVITSPSLQTANSVVFSSGAVTVVEGLSTNDSFVYQADTKFYEIPNQQVDTSSIKVTVIDDQSVTTEYKQASSVVGIDQTQNVFFVRIAPNGNYSIYFGNGVVGAQPTIGSIIVVEYRISNGQLPNNINVFTPGQAIDGETNIVVTTISNSQGGDVYQDIESIRYSGEQAAVTQERSIYENDFENDIRGSFPIIADINVIGGEKLSPPKYGHIVITAVDTELNNLITPVKNEITAFLAGRVPLTTTFSFADANILRVGLDVKVKTTDGQLSDTTKSLIVSSLGTFSDTVLSRFGASAIRSKIETAIDNSSTNIIGNVTSLVVHADVFANQGVSIATGNPISSVTSSVFTYNNTSATLTSLNGKLYVIDSAGLVISSPVGMVVYGNGNIVLDRLGQQFNQLITLTIAGVNADLMSSGTMLLKIKPSDIRITI